MGGRYFIFDFFKDIIIERFEGCIRNLYYNGEVGKKFIIYYDLFVCIYFYKFYKVNKWYCFKFIFMYKIYKLNK